MASIWHRAFLCLFCAFLLCSRADLKASDTYESFAFIKVGIRGTLTLKYRRYLPPTDDGLPFFSASFGHGQDSPLSGSPAKLEILGYRVLRFAPQNNFEFEITLKFPEPLPQDPIVLRYKEVLYEGRHHELNNYEAGYAPRFRDNFWKVKFHVYQDSGPRLLELVCQTHNTQGIPEMHLVGRLGEIPGVEVQPMDEFDIPLEAMTLEADHRAANGGMKTIGDLVRSMNGLLETGDPGDFVDDPRMGSLSFEEFFPNTHPSSENRKPLVKIQIFPKETPTPKERTRGNYFYTLKIALSTELSTADRDYIMSHIAAILRGEKNAMPMAGVWIREPSFFRWMNNKRRGTHDDIEFYAMSSKAPYWKVYTDDRVGLDEQYGRGPDTALELHQSPLPLPYFEELASDAQDPDEAWKGPKYDVDESGQRTLISTWGRDFFDVEARREMTFEELFTQDSRCEEWALRAGR